MFDIEIVRLGEQFRLSNHRRLLDAAAQLGARALLVAGDDRDTARLADAYAALAEECAHFGLVASLDFMPCTAVRDARTAVSIVAHADGPARSVLVDSLHVARSTTRLADLAAIPPEWVHYAQLSDGSVPAPVTEDELIRQAREERLVPGDGGIDLTGNWSVLPAQTSVSVEVPNPRQRCDVGTEVWLDRLAAASRAQVGQ